MDYEQLTWALTLELVPFRHQPELVPIAIESALELMQKRAPFTDEDFQEALKLRNDYLRRYPPREARFVI